ncbi:hypothetical protein RUND412_003807 [Rhizina undulata]
MDTDVMDESRMVIHYSDGETQHYPIQTEKVFAEKDRSYNYFCPVADGNAKDDLWRKKIGRALVESFGLCSVDDNWILQNFKLPKGYRLFEHIKGNEKGNERSDTYLFGHPSGKKYTSPNKFKEHIIYLAKFPADIDESAMPDITCSCLLCAGGKGAKNRNKVLSANMIGSSVNPHVPENRKQISNASLSDENAKKSKHAEQSTTSVLENAEIAILHGSTGNKKLDHPETLLFQQKLDKIKGPPLTLVNDVDDDPSPPLGFEFIDELRRRENVPERKIEFEWGCDCGIGGCTPEACQCIQEMHDNEFAYTVGGKVARDSAHFLIECNQYCRCGPGCRNRVVQKGRQLPLEIFKTEKKGWGLCCPQRIKKGTFIDLYFGEVICPEEAERRTTLGNSHGLSYLFDLDKLEDMDENSLDDDEESQRIVYTIDGQYCGGVTRFINHSCDPNLEIYTVTSERRDFRVYDLALFAIRDIAPNEELTYSYVKKNDELKNEGEDTRKGKETKNTNKGEKVGKWPCHCGATNCIKFLWWS